MGELRVGPLQNGGAGRIRLQIDDDAGDVVVEVLLREQERLGAKVRMRRGVGEDATGLSEVKS